MSWWSDKPKQQVAQDKRQLESENSRALSGLAELAQKLNASNDKDQRDSETMERYLQRLRKEGSGR